MLGEPEIQAKPESKGFECPTCADRFPPQENLEEHTKEEHQLAG